MAGCKTFPISRWTNSARLAFVRNSFQKTRPMSSNFHEVTATTSVAFAPMSREVMTANSVGLQLFISRNSRAKHVGEILKLALIQLRTCCEITNLAYFVVPGCQPGSPAAGTGRSFARSALSSHDSAISSVRTALSSRPSAFRFISTGRSCARTGLNSVQSGGKASPSGHSPDSSIGRTCPTAHSPLHSARRTRPTSSPTSSRTRCGRHTPSRTTARFSPRCRETRTRAAARAPARSRTTRRRSTWPASSRTTSTRRSPACQTRSCRSCGYLNTI